MLLKSSAVAGDSELLFGVYYWATDTELPGVVASSTI